MKQDLKRLKEKINNIKKYNTYRYDWTEIDIQTIEHLIKAYKELEEENTSKQKAYDDCYCEFKHYKQYESIPVSLVEEKIEELNKLITEVQKELGSASKEYTIYVYQKDIL